MPNTLRSCIVASKGYTFISLDASQIELKVVAILCQDPGMLVDTKSKDLHLATALRVFGMPTREEALESLSRQGNNEATEEEIEGWIKDELKKRRYDAKQLNFAILYGAEAYKIAQMADISEERAQELIDQYFQAYPVLKQWMDRMVNKARQDGFVMNMFGRIRPIPDLFSRIWKVKAKAEREVVNTIVQGTAVDIVKLAMLYMRNIFDKSIRLVLQVHDEMLWEVPDELLSQALEQCKELKFAFPDYPFKICIGKVYGEIQEYKE